jgi:hypothetical protein
VHRSLLPDPFGRVTVHERTETNNDSKISQSNMSTTLAAATTSSTPFDADDTPGAAGVGVDGNGCVDGWAVLRLRPA